MVISTEDLSSLKSSILKGLKNGNLKQVADYIITLKSWKATTETLKSTRIGVFVTDLRKHEQANDEIKAASKECVAKWKSDIGRLSVPNLNTESREFKNNPSSDSLNDKHISSNEVSAQSIIERNVSIDKIAFGTSLNDKIRIKCSEVLYGALASGTDVPPKSVAKVTRLVEEAVFDHFKSVSDQYKSKLRSLVSNLRDKSNPNLKIRVLEGEVTPERFALMTPEELMSEDRLALVTEVRKANMEEALTQKPVHSATDIFKCGKCKQRKTTYYQMQTRSADEPMTTFVTCLVCENRWKFC